MAFIDDWRTQLQATLPEVAALVEQPQDIHLGLLAAAALWPIRAQLRAAEPSALNAIQSLAGIHASELIQRLHACPDDLLRAGRALDRFAQVEPELAAALGQLVGQLGIAQELSSHLVTKFVPSPNATHFLGNIQNALQNVGGVVSIASLTIALPLSSTSTARPPIDPATAHARLAALPLDVIPEVVPLPTPHLLPISANPLFVGCDAELRALATVLKPRAGVAAITTGMGGVGKTQLVAEFAHRYGQFFAGGVFWLSFADPVGIDAQIAACGGPGGLELYTAAAGLTQAEQVARVIAVWEQDIPRLLIFDNCDDHTDATAATQLAGYLPRSGGCRVLVTSRSGHWPTDLGITAHPLDMLPRDKSLELLRGYRTDLSDAHAGAIAAELGDLPLALTLAGSYLATYHDERFGQPATYLVNLRKSLLTHRSLRGAGAPISLTGHDLDVYATMDLSYQRLDATDPTDALAIAALARAAWLAPGEPFPRDLLLATLANDKQCTEEETALRRTDALRRLVRLGLLEMATTGALRLHRLIAAFTRHKVADTSAKWIHRLIAVFSRHKVIDNALAAVERVLSDTGYDLLERGVPASFLPIQAHLRHCADQSLTRLDQRASELCTLMARYLRLVGNYTDALPYARHALEIDQATRHVDALTIAVDLNDIAGLLHHQGNYTAARTLYERAHAIVEHSLGRAHPITASSLNNLAAVLQDQGNYLAARLLFERALQFTEQALGSEHPDTANSLNNLAALLKDQGDYLAARPLFERALAILEQAFGPEHPTIAGSLNNLAVLLKEQGDYEAARPLYERALAICEQAFGPEHPNTAGSLNNLARLLQDQGDYEAARLLFERALAIREHSLGPGHPDTAGSLNNLAFLLKTQSDYTAARPLYERALAIREHSLGPEHPDTASSLNNLAGLLEEQGDYAAAQTLYKRALAIREHSLGSEHPDTASSLNNLAGLLEEQGEYQAARPLYERALAIKERVLGPEHPDTGQILNNLALLLKTQGDYEAARPLYERALAICEQAFGPEHPNTHTISTNLAALDEPQQTCEEQIAKIIDGFDSAVAETLADPTSDRIALIQQLEDRARWAEDGKAEDSPYLALAAHLRVLAAQLNDSGSASQLLLPVDSTDGDTA